MNKQVTTTIKLQKNLHYQLQQRVIEDGYGMRGKSRWIVEAITAFLRLSDYPNLVDIADDMEQQREAVSIRVPEKLMQQIENGVIAVRKSYPAMEGVKSNLIRASIMQRLIRGNTSGI